MDHSTAPGCLAVIVWFAVGGCGEHGVSASTDQAQACDAHRSYRCNSAKFPHVNSSPSLAFCPLCCQGVPTEEPPVGAVQTGRGAKPTGGNRNTLYIETEARSGDASTFMKSRFTAAGALAGDKSLVMFTWRPGLRATRVFGRPHRTCCSCWEQETTALQRRSGETREPSPFTFALCFPRIRIIALNGHKCQKGLSCQAHLILHWVPDRRQRRRS